jgi:hypothetical protein
MARPLLLKTPLAVFRKTIKETIRVSQKNRKTGALEKVDRRVPISSERIAEWLGCSESFAKQLALGKKTMPESDAIKLMEQTGVDPLWVAGYEQEDKPMVSVSNHPYSQEWFDGWRRCLAEFNGDFDEWHNWTKLTPADKGFWRNGAE